MTFLELCKRLRGECGLAGDGPFSVVNSVGIDTKVINWISDTYAELQSEDFPWPWLRPMLNLDLNAGAADFSQSALGRSDIESFDPVHTGLVAADGQYIALRVVPFEEFLRECPSVRTTTRPSAVTILPDGTVRFNALLDAPYRLETLARISPQILLADSDVPRMPAQFHLMLVHGGKMRYAGHDEASVLWKDAQLLYATAKTKLIERVIPAIQYGARPLI